MAGPEVNLDSLSDDELMFLDSLPPDELRTTLAPAEAGTMKSAGDFLGNFVSGPLTDPSKQGDVPVTGNQGVPDSIRAQINTLLRADPTKSESYLRSLGYETMIQPSGELVVRKPGEQSWSGIEQTVFPTVGSQFAEGAKDIALDAGDDLLEASLQTAMIPQKGANLFGKSIVGGATASGITDAITQTAANYSMGQPLDAAQLATNTATGGVVGAGSWATDRYITPMARKLAETIAGPMASIIDEGGTVIGNSFAPTSKSASGLGKESFYTLVKELEDTTDFFASDTVTFDDVVQKAIRKIGGEFDGTWKKSELGPQISAVVSKLSEKTPGVPADAIWNQIAEVQEQIGKELIGAPARKQKAVDAVIEGLKKDLPAGKWVSLSKVYDLQKSLDRQVGRAFNIDRIELVGKRPDVVAQRDIAGVFRRTLKDEADAIAKEAVDAGNIELATTAGKLKSLKREYEIIKELLPDFERARIIARQDKTGDISIAQRIKQGAIGGGVGAGAGSIVGMPYVGGAIGAGVGLMRPEGQPLKPSTQALAQGLLARNFRGLGAPAISQTVGAATLRKPALLGLAALETPLLIPRKVEKILKQDDGIGYVAQALKNATLTKLLKGKSLPMEEDAQAMMIDEVSMEADSEVQPIIDQLQVLQQRSDEDGFALMMSDLAKEFPTAFEKSKTGYLSEMSQRGKTYLADPADQASYRQRLRNDENMDLIDRAKKMSALNRNGEVI